MAGTTTKGLRYPTGTDVMSPVAIKNLADDIDPKLSGRANPDTAWITMTLIGGWSHLDVRYAQYRRLGGVVYLRGIMLGGTMNVPFFNMPAGFRWTSTITGNEWHYPCISNGYLGGVSGTNAFDLQVIVGSNAWVDLMHIKWVADQ